MSSQPKTHTIKLEFFPDDLFEYCKLEVILRSYIQKSRNIPPEIVKRFLDIPERAQKTKASLRQQLLGEKCALAQSFVKKYEQGFVFNAQKKVRELMFQPPPGTPVIRKRRGERKTVLKEKVYSSDGMIERLFESLMMHEKIEKLLVDKVELTNYIARAFESYLSTAVFEKAPSHFPSVNRRCKIAGCVLLAFGLIVDEATFKSMITAKMYYKEHLASCTYHLYTKQVKLLNSGTE